VVKHGNHRKRIFLFTRPLIGYHSGVRNDIKRRPDNETARPNSDFPQMNGPGRIGMTMYVLGSILVLVLLSALFWDALDRQHNPNSSPTSIITNDGAVSIILHRNRAGHYVVDGTINGQHAEFLLDTGATAVSISGSFATQLGLKKGPPMRAITANGVTTAYSTYIDSISIGDINERNVAATIIPNLPGNQILLGMSFLKRLDFSQRDASLTLTQRAIPQSN